jgi:hypothetical protein
MAGIQNLVMHKKAIYFNALDSWHDKIFIDDESEQGFAITDGTDPRDISMRLFSAMQMAHTDVEEKLPPNSNELYCLCEYHENSKEVKVGVLAPSIEQLAQEAYSKKLLREPFSIWNTKKSKVLSTGYAEISVTPEEILEFVKQYQKINYGKEF